MNKKTILICGIILVLLTTLAILFNSNNNNSLRQNGVTYALTVDGETQNKFPGYEDGIYRVDTQCVNAKCKWDYDAWKLYVEDVTGSVSCNIEFTTVSKTNFNDYIIGLSGTTQGDGKVVNEKGYRYEGTNPNNYVLFNNELWRIIGVFGNDERKTEKLVKIIRNDSIGSLTWHPNGSTGSVWNEAYLNRLLNGYYIDGLNATSIYMCNGYGYNSNAKCNYHEIGIKGHYGYFVGYGYWHLGADSNSNISTDSMYNYEIKINTSDIKIGLMNASDYGYAALEEDCDRGTLLNSYDNGRCTLNNWLYKGENEWTLTAGYYSKQAFSIASNGVVFNAGIDSGLMVRPALYLKSNVYVIDGTGAETDPYIIGMQKTS